jgi:transcriptional regulator with XRE-family HTH domain
LATTPNKVRRLVQRALDTATPTLRDLAGRAKLSYHAVRQYRLGARTPGRSVLRKLARVLRKQARDLLREADRLDRVADRNGKEGN